MTNKELFNYLNEELQLESVRTHGQWQEELKKVYELLQGYQQAITTKRNNDCK